MNNHNSSENRPTIGVLYICTGRYRVFWPKYYATFRTYFFPGYKRKIFIFSDTPREYFTQNTQDDESIELIHVDIENKPWPFITLLRYRLFVEHKDLWKTCDYIFFTNCDYVFHQQISSEILPSAEESGLVIAELQKSIELNPTEYPYERNPESTAYIPIGKGSHYYTGAFNGGKTDSFLKLCFAINEATNRDLENDIIAVWHDESQLNAYLVDKKVRILPPWYVWPSYWITRKNRHMVIAGPEDKDLHGGHAWLRGATDKKKKSKFMRRLPRYIAIATAAVVAIASGIYYFLSQ